MSNFEPYLGSLKAPETFSKDWDAGRRFNLRGTGHLMALLGIVGLATGYVQTVLTLCIIFGIFAILRGQMHAKSSTEWAEPDQFDLIEEIGTPMEKAYARTIPWVALIAVAFFGLSLALFLSEAKFFMIGVCGMAASAVAFVSLLRD